MTSAAPLLIRHARLAGSSGFSTHDLRVKDGRIETLAAGGTLAAEPGEEVIEADYGLVMPAFVDLHTHLDKGHITPRRANPDGSFKGAFDAVAADRAAHWTAEDVEARMEFSLRAAYAHGTAAIRTHLDSAPPQHAITWPVFAKVRERWAGRIDLQAVALCGPDLALDKTVVDEIARTAKHYGGALGGAISLFDRAEEAIGNLVEAAGRHGLDLDLHIDESGDPASRSLSVLARTVLDRGFGGRVIAGHCCSLAIRPEAEVEETLALVAKAGIAVVSLPLCNLFLQDRTPNRTPRWRGVTLLHELTAAGIAVALASDNTRDPFYAYGDLDMMEVLRESVRIGHLDYPQDHLAAWFAAVSAVPASLAGFGRHGRIEVGASADLLLFRARNPGELFARPQSDRTIIRAGAIIRPDLPDYRDLDEVFGAQPARQR
ncbi:cytosine deaminase [Rhizobium sp. CC-YZS058]|uniref:cytosine deaminase n=1 Tax=Rhizobium sp. CC-YZS058 TaxID=3042153 RepID=UPI002B05A57B|nr:cytosine deaminase [Rhizobium sp. CC-YZS058]MEA3533131.1 cytosine deaminase [Rhizobium sp. CC-YZS058]